MATHLADVGERRENVNPLAFQSCWITLWMTSVSSYPDLKNAHFTAGGKHHRGNHFGAWLSGKGMMERGVQIATSNTQTSNCAIIV